METRLVIIAITPTIIIILGLFFSDRYDREPLKLLMLTFVLGALTVIPVLFVERFLANLNIFPGVLSAFYGAFIVAGLTEEYFKRKVVLLIPYKTKYFNEKLDGIIYCVFSSMGFATVENIIYVAFRYTHNQYIGLYRGIFSVPAHAIFGITMGYYLSLAKFGTNEKRRKANLRKSLYMPVILHGTFNFLLMVDLPELTMLFLPYVLYLWWDNSKKLGKYYFDSKSRFVTNQRKDIMK